MISYRNQTFTNSAVLDLFNGNSSSGKWVVHLEISVANGTIRLSPDGSTLGQELSQTRGSGYFHPYRFVVEDQPLYLISDSATNSHVNVTILPLVEGNVSLGVCSC